MRKVIHKGLVENKEYTSSINCIPITLTRAVYLLLQFLSFTKLHCIVYFKNINTKKKVLDKIKNPF